MHWPICGITSGIINIYKSDDNIIGGIIFILIGLFMEILGFKEIKKEK